MTQEEIIKKLKEDKKYMSKCIKLLQYHNKTRIYGKAVNCEYQLDEVEGKSKPFFNMFATLEDLGIHLRIKMDGDNFYGNIYDHLVKVLKEKGLLEAERDAAEIMMLFFKGCSESTKNKKNPFYISIKGLNG